MATCYLCGKDIPKELLNSKNLFIVQDKKYFVCWGCIDSSVKEIILSKLCNVAFDNALEKFNDSLSEGNKLNEENEIIPECCGKKTILDSDGNTFSEFCYVCEDCGTEHYVKKSSLPEGGK